MADFNPYHKWLGIPFKDQPPNHYRLLGVELLEENADVIAIAADRQMGFLRTFQAGQYSTASQRLLSEVVAARNCLLDPEKKAAYDEQLVGGLEDVSLEDLDEVELIEEDASSTQVTDVGLGQPLPPPGGCPAAEPDGDLGTVGNYQMLRALDKNRSGAVFKARHLSMSRIVAVKILSQRAVESEQLAQRFARKIRILARLSHPHLIAIHNAGEFKGRPYMEMEYIEGRSLGLIVQQVGPLPIPHVVNYTLQAATGLGFAHENGVYHRNVKPDNLLVENATGMVKVIGLGLARLTGPLAEESAAQQMLTTPGTTMGTFDYMAPEQFADASGVDHRADVYSLGCTVHSLVTGNPPFHAVKSPMKKLLGHRDGAIPSLGAIRSDVPHVLEMVYQKMMAKKPEQRYQSMAEVVDALANI